MNVFQAAVLGIVQGLTEFLPISSSGHLILVPKIFGWSTHDLVFDTILHLGTTTAVVIYFFKDLLAALKNKKLMILLIIGSVPAGVIGFFLESFLEEFFRGVSSVAIFLALGAFLMYAAENFYTRIWANQRKNSEDQLTPKDSFIVGLFQALALLPGFSRSGSTISGGMLFGLTRDMAAKFSFLLSVPIVVLAAFYKIYQSYNMLTLDASLLVGYLTSFIVGLFTIDFLIKFLRTKKLTVFVIYRLVLAIILLAVF